MANLVLRSVVIRRFIPARAGNGLSWMLMLMYPTVHPRSRGEWTKTGRKRLLTGGSSPLARGMALGSGEHGRLQRFIPARAGNGIYRGAPVSPDPVHPRSRGEWCRRITRAACVSGSSPLARGMVHPLNVGVCPLRFIPARAGNGSCAMSEYRAKSVHPRSRGEWVSTTASVQAAIGSSPLARGMGLTIEGDRRSLRFIPARAGNGS